MSNQKRYSGEWKTKQLSDICIPRGIVRGPFGGTLKKDIFVPSGFKVYQQQNAIYKNPEIGSYFIDQSKYAEMHRFSVSPGDFIVSCSGTIGRIFQISPDAPQGVINQALLKITTNDEFVYDQYFYILFEWDEFQNKIIDSTQGGAIKNLVGMNIFRTIPVTLPPLEEQRAIAEVLSDVDGLINALDALIAKKRAIKQATMQQLLTGKTRLPGFSGEWETKRLGEIAQIKKGSMITEKDVVLGTIPVIAGGQKPAYYHNTANRTGKTITVSASGVYAGFVALYNQPIFASDCSTISESSHYSIDFIYYYLVFNQNVIYNAQTGGAQPHCYPTDLMTMQIDLPLLEEQRAIAAVLSDMDAEIAALEQRRDKTIAIKQGMMQQLLTGKVRLLK
ncbi:hypothetical protein F4X73_08855 [Candidatus Poribacteria bacterium]|nr:hypothetical protein [Candidatus Poribacteria bacterium]